eukprot:930963-Amorphochlora_amoeboformis.AAC.1
MSQPLSIHTRPKRTKSLQFDSNSFEFSKSYAKNDLIKTATPSALASLLSRALTPPPLQTKPVPQAQSSAEPKPEGVEEIKSGSRGKNSGNSEKGTGEIRVE